MRKPDLGLVTVAALAFVGFSALAAQSQAVPTRWEYVRLDGIQIPASSGMASRSIYRACRATTTDWHCRDFEMAANMSPDLALREALFTLGQDGWELVATVPAAEPQFRASYLFKRQAPAR